ncbi:MAG: hypothetical protein NTW14_05375 [bacterium]|nr:hypothetical protein [bacterium]
MRLPTAIVLLSAILLAFGCTVKQPGTPRWQTDFTVPIADKTYSIFDIITDTNLVSLTGDDWVSVNSDTVFANFTDSIEKVFVDSALNYEAFNHDVETYVGVRKVNSPGSQSKNINVTALDSFIGQYTPIPPFNIPASTEPLQQYAEYEWVYLDSGDVTITVANNLPVVLDNLNLEIWTQSPSLQIATLHLSSPLPAGSSTSSTQPMPIHQKISNMLEIRLSGYSSGSVDPVNVGEINNIAVTVNLSDLWVDSALAHIPAQTFEEDTLIVLEESNVLKAATIKSGSVTYTLTNHTNLINEVTFTLPDFSKNGQLYVETTELDTNETVTLTGELTGYLLQRPQMDNVIEARVTCQILDTSDPAYGISGNFVQVAASQAVLASFAVSDLYFSAFEGQITDTEIDIVQPAQILQNVPGGLDSLDVAIVFNHLAFSNVINTPIELNLTLLAYKYGHVVVTAPLPTLLIPAGTMTAPGILDTIFTGTRDIANVLPDSILPIGTARVNNYVNLEDWQWIEGVIHIYSPFIMTIGKSSLEPQQTEIDEGFENNLLEVVLNIDVQNHMPLSGQALVLSSYDSTEFRKEFSSEVDTFAVLNLPPATLDWAGYVVNPGVAAFNQTLDLEHLNMFASASPSKPLYFQTFVLINSTNGDTVRFRTDDHIVVGASAHIEVDADLGN